MNPLTFLAITVSCVFGRKLPQRNSAEQQHRLRIPLCELIATIVFAFAGRSPASKTSIAFAKSAARKVADSFLMSTFLISAKRSFRRHVTTRKQAKNPYFPRVCRYFFRPHDDRVRMSRAWITSRKPARAWRGTVRDGRIVEACVDRC